MYPWENNLMALIDLGMGLAMNRSKGDLVQHVDRPILV